MKNIEQLNEEYNDLRGRVIALCYNLPYPQVFKEPIIMEMVNRETEEILGLDSGGYLYNADGNIFSFLDDVVGVGELLYLLENI